MKKLLLVFYSLFITVIAVNAQPCTGIPTAGTVSVYPSALCASTAPIYLVVTGYTPGIGISFLWNEGLNGNNTWISIPNSNNDTLVLNYLPTVSTDYNVIITCLNSGLSDASGGITLSPPYPSSSSCPDSVWPGDINRDLIVDNNDVLYLGVAMNDSGIGLPRQNASINYVAQFAYDWAQSFSNGVNIKNADCNGNDTVQANDMVAITNNFGLTHPKGASTPRAKVTTDPGLYFDDAGIQFISGTTVSVPIKLGNAAIPMNRIYGLAATIKIDGFSPVNAPTTSYSTSWLGSANNTLRFEKAINNSNLAWAYVRTDHHNVSGNGTLAYLNFDIPSNAAGQLILKLENVTVIDSIGNINTNYNVENDTTVIIPVSVRNVLPELHSATIIPNPSTGKTDLNIAAIKEQILNVSVTDLTGKIIWEKLISVQEGKNILSLPIELLQAGLYFVRLSDEQGLTQALKWMKN
jgi:hypothetical protein